MIAERIGYRLGSALRGRLRWLFAGLAGLFLVWLMVLRPGQAPKPEEYTYAAVAKTTDAAVKNSVRRTAADTYDPTAMLPAAKRFSLVPVGHALRPTQDALNKGDIMGAVELFQRLPVTADDRKTPLGRSLSRAIDKAFAQISGGQTKGSAAVETIETYWAPKLNAIPETPPDSPETLGKRVSDMDELGLAIHDTENSDLTPGEKAKVAAFKAALVSKQARVFPVLRKAYVKLQSHGLWLNNVDARVTGDHATTFQLTGVAFASNRAVEELEGTNEEILTRLRFKRAEYRWYEGGPQTYYKIASPGDREVGYRESGNFVPVR